MKTKQILSILAVPAFLAACTAENDFLVNDTQELAGRKVLSEMNIGFVGANQLNSRLSMGEAAVELDSNDRIAAALIDRNAVGDESDLVNGYVITDGIATNHPFTTTDDQNWSTPTQLLEGNYLFYYQYNEALGGNRNAAVPYTIANNQFAYAENAKTVFVGDQAVKDNAVGIGYAWLGADATGYTPKNVNVQMYNLFAFLKFNIKTSDKTGLEVQQIKVEPVASKFKLSGKINNASIAEYGIKTADRNNVTESNPANAGLLVAGEEVTYTSTFADEEDKETAYIILSLPDLAINAAAQSAYVVIPAADYKNNNLVDVNESVSGAEAAYPEFKIMVYTNQGVYTTYKELYLDPAGNSNTPQLDLASLTMGKVQPMSLDISGTLEAASEYFVGSAEEWQKVLNSLPKYNGEAVKPVTINLLADVGLAKADIDLLTSTNAGDYALTVAGEAMILTESCSLSSITIEEVTVNSGVEVDLNGNTIITTLTNNGTVNFNEVATTTPVTSVAEATTLTNNGVAEFNATTTIKTVTSGSAVADADNSAVTLKVNAGTLTIETLTSNKGAGVEIAAGAELQAAGTNNGTIKVDGNLISTGTLTNNGAVEVANGAIVTSLSGNTITNLGSIEAAAGSLVKIGENGNDDVMGVVTYNDGADVAVNGATYRGKIAYVITEEYEVPGDGVEYNTIVVDGLNITLGGDLTAATGVTNIVIKNNSTLNVSKVETKLNLVEVEGKNTIVTSGGGLSTSTLVVAANSYLNIPLYSKITADVLKNESRIDVGGTLIYIADGSTEGTILGSGTVTEN